MSERPPDDPIDLSDAIEAKELDLVPDELKPEYKRLHAILRGNERRVAQLNERKQGFDFPMYVLGRLDTYIDFMLGDTVTSAKRIEFEIKFAEDMRRLLNQALLVT